MKTELEIQRNIDIAMGMFLKDVHNEYLRGIIVAYREILGEDSTKVLMELHSITNSIGFANAEV